MGDSCLATDLSLRRDKPAGGVFRDKAHEKPLLSTP